MAAPTLRGRRSGKPGSRGSSERKKGEMEGGVRDCLNSGRDGWRAPEGGRPYRQSFPSGGGISPSPIPSRWSSRINTRNRRISNLVAAPTKSRFQRIFQHVSRVVSRLHCGFGGRRRRRFTMNTDHPYQQRRANRAVMFFRVGGPDGGASHKHSRVHTGSQASPRIRLKKSSALPTSPMMRATTTSKNLPSMP